VIVAYNGVQDRARQSKIQADIRSITVAIRLARDSTQKVAGQITGSYATGGNCWAKADGTDLAALPNTDPCIVQYNNSIGALVTASGASIANIRDPWGRPYLIDENENEGGGCLHDTVAVYKQPFTTGFGAYASTPTNNVANSGYSGCTN
jgi:type II secretory pathway pseudopilin PulG